MDLTRNLAPDVLGQAPTPSARDIEDLALLEDVTRAANEADTAEQAMRYALQRICESKGWEAGHAFQANDDLTTLRVKRGYWYQAPRALRSLRDATLHRSFPPGEGLPGRVFATGEPLHIADLTDREATGPLLRHEITGVGLRSWIGIPVRVGGQVRAVIELMGSRPLPNHDSHDTENNGHEQKDNEQHFLSLMARIGDRLGHVLERERFQQRMIDANWRKQQHVSRELHEDVAQQLTGMAMLAESLRQQLVEAGRPEARSCAAIVETARDLQQHTGSLARELFPVDMSAGGLPAALEALAAHTASNHSLLCNYEGERTLPDLNEETATHLYCIAEEAVANAVLHGQPSRLTLSLQQDRTRLVLRIRDDGAAIPPEASDGLGTGLRCMRCRAAAIGARLRVGPAPNRGTVTLCEMPLMATDTPPATDTENDP